MSYKTEPKGKLTQKSPIHWEDEDEDIVATSLFLQTGLTVNYNREVVVSFKTRLDNQGKFKEADDIHSLYKTDQVIILRCDELQAYFLMGPLVREFQLLSKSIIDYQRSIGVDPKGPLGTKAIYSKYLQEAEPRYKQLIDIFDKIVGLKCHIDEKSLKEDAGGIHYLFIKK